MILPWRSAVLLLAPLAAALRDLGPKDRCLEKARKLRQALPLRRKEFRVQGLEFRNYR